ncbi:MAG: hypothetical protein JXO22_06670, partial [Phycisphaerae bacterium]|nr:hypothetical protein [Phycisphaerae bacterium]
LDRERATPAEAPPDCFLLALDHLQLKPNERQLLQDIAQRAALPEPAAMLLSPENLMSAYERATSDAGRSIPRRNLNAICETLFGAALPAAKTSPHNNEPTTDIPAKPDAV